MSRNCAILPTFAHSTHRYMREPLKISKEMWNKDQDKVIDEFIADMITSLEGKDFENIMFAYKESPRVHQALRTIVRIQIQRKIDESSNI